MASSRNTNTILKISARAFTNPFSTSPSSTTCRKIGVRGGNPVTIFHFPSENNTKQKQSIPSSKLRSHLAKTCSWESVISYSSYRYNEGDNNRVWFYMPSGEEVSYCAHAAMAACSVLKDVEKTSKGKNRETIQFLTGIIDDDNEEGNEVKISPSLLENTATVEATKTKNRNGDNNDGETLLNEVTLQISSTLNEEQVDHEITLELLDQVGLSYEDVMIDDDDNVTYKLPSFINSSVARNKTLIPMKSTSTLHSATNPKDEIIFRDLCDKIQSTGLYLYSPSSSSTTSYECRQFPRFSGYPEDPATGIAAAALANSLYSRGVHTFNDSNTSEVDTDKVVVYTIFQGTAMQKPSRIRICFEKNNHSNGPLLSCSGIVEVDELSRIELPEI